MPDYPRRRDRLTRVMRRSGVPALLVTNVHNVTYLTGFSGDDSFLLIGDDQPIVLSDPRYTQQLCEECGDLRLEIRPPGKTILDTLSRVVSARRLSTVAIESQSLTVAAWQQFQAAMPGVSFPPAEGLVEELRQIKDRDEILAIRESIRVAEKAFGVIRASVREEQTEREVAFSLEEEIRRFGGSGCSFPPIVAVGPRAALPHATPTDRAIGESPFTLVDWGAMARMYASDLTRVLVTAKIPPKLERIYGVVFKAQQAAVDVIRPGVLPNEVDEAARRVIAEAGFGKRFGHGLGHGIGLEIHEAPRLAANQRRPLRAGMVVTVEPGVYLPNWGGVRIEDDVLVTRQGHEVLTTLPRQLSDSVVAC